LLRIDTIVFEPEPNKVEMCGDARQERKARGAPDAPSMRARFVQFTKGAHTKWHRHTGEQLLYVTN
jgi:quercetin dioxygenase-like cupin family protein